MPRRQGLAALPIAAGVGLLDPLDRRRNTAARAWPPYQSPPRSGTSITSTLHERCGSAELVEKFERIEGTDLAESGTSIASPASATSASAAARAWPPYRCGVGAGW